MRRRIRVYVYVCVCVSLPVSIIYAICVYVDSYSGNGSGFCSAGACGSRLPREGGRENTYNCSLLEKTNDTTGAGGAVNPIIALAELTKGEKKKPWEFWKNDPK
jgi:hypothetical protein